MTTTPFRSFTYDAQPFALPENVELREDLIYESASGQEWPLDLFLPCVRPHPVPAVVYLHGGGGRPGNRQQFWRHAAFLASRGIAGASIQHPFRNIAVPQAAVRWLRRSSAELGIDPLRIGAAGSSAGSYLACLLGILDAAQNGTQSKVKAVLSQKGLYGSGIARDVQYFGDLLQELSPHRHATPQTAPTLLIHAAEDENTPYEGVVAYHRRLLELGVPCELITDPAATHGLTDKTSYYDRVIPLFHQFFQKHL